MDDRNFGNLDIVEISSGIERVGTPVVQKTDGVIGAITNFFQGAVWADSFPLYDPS
jgi:hypothetical protein